MLSLYNIWTVARYEMKTLRRSWFFRIFAGLALIMLIFFNIGIFANVGNDSSWMWRGISSSLPYANILLMNVVQAVIAVFLASDFLKRDKKLDTTEVVYMRSMTNGDYVLGKTLGIFIVFMALNAAVLIVAAVFNIFFTGAPMVVLTYLLYPLLISIPTLIFIFGLSFLFMVVIRNQAVTFIVLLGYIALTLFFLSNKLHYIFDYMAFNVPMMYSDFIGFGNISEILIHRGIYFSLGFGFIFGTIFLLKRLPQSLFMRRLSLTLTFFFMASGIVLSTMYITQLSKNKSLRKEMISINDRLIQEPHVVPVRLEIDLNHQGDHFDAKAHIVFKNNSSKPIDNYIFSLNPGLEVSRVDGEGQPSFERDVHILSVKPKKPLDSMLLDSLTISYSGTIHEEACYLDVNEAKRDTLYKAWLYNIDKRHAFVTKNYVLLTPEAMWYPVPGITYSSEHPETHTINFLNFRLQVTTDNKLTALSQGRGEQNEGKFTFIPEFPLCQMSLVIGPYEKQSITVDSIEYSIMILEGHDFFAPYLDAVGDTLSFLVRDLKQDFENQLEMFYPYNRLSLVEVPIQFFNYRREWTVGSETVQPEMVLLPEKGILLRGADFQQMNKWDRRRSQRSNQVRTPVESQSRYFTRFVESTVLSEGGNRFRGRRSSESFFSEINYSLFPNYYTFVNYLKSDKWPILNIALEYYLSQRTENTLRQAFISFFVGITDQEKTNLALDNKTMVEVLSDPARKNMIRSVLKTKGDYLFTLLESKVGMEIFGAFLNKILADFRFQVLDIDAFNQLLKNQFQLDFEPDIGEWYDSRQLPGYLLSDIVSYKVLDGDRTRFQVRFKVTNTEPVDGIMVVSFRTGGGGGRDGGRGHSMMMGSSDTDIERIISLQANQTKEIGVVLDGPPRAMTVNTLVSKNLPSIIMESFEELELNKNVEPFDGENRIDTYIPATASNEIIVDNEDTGFEVFNPTSTSFLKKLLRISSDNDEEKYIGMRFWRPPERWRATTGSNFYGTVVKSAVFTRAGRGERKVSWNTVIRESGTYDVYAYIYISPMGRMGRGRGRGRSEPENEQYHFNIFHDDGVEETILDIGNAELGWNFLGNFYLSADSAKIELTNESQGRIVTADAVKWVRQ